MARPRVTLHDVARAVGLSANTVSRALAGKDQVSEQTRARVVDEARRLGYTPNSHARSLVSGTTTVVGLVITNPSNPFYAELISTVERACRSAGYSVLLLVTDESHANEQDAVEQLLTYGVDGVIGVPVQDRPEPWRRLVEAGVPVVLVSRDIPELGLDFVGTDVENGVADAVGQVADPTTTRAWLFEEDLPISTTAARIDGFHRALDTARIDRAGSLVIKVPTHRTSGASLPWRPDDAYHLAVNLITPRAHPDLLVAGNDYFALGVLRAARECGLRVPDDIAVLGYGDHPFSAYLDPGLSSLRLPSAEVGTLAVGRLMERIADPELDRRTTLRRPELVRRGSTRPPQA